MKNKTKNVCFVVALILLFVSLDWNSFTFGRIINIDPSQTTGWTSIQCCGQYCCDGNCCGYQTCCNGLCCGYQNCCDATCCGGYQTCCNSSCCGGNGTNCCNSTCCDLSCCPPKCCTNSCCPPKCCVNPCCGAQCCRLPCCGALPSYYRQTNNINDRLIASWQENSSSNWTILSGYIRFTLHGDCGGGSVNVLLNGQQITQVSVSNGVNQSVEILLNNNAISSIIRGGTNTVSLFPSQNGNCMIAGGLNFGPSPSSTTIIQIQLIYCGESTDLQSPKECDGGSGCNKTTCQCERERE